jgi:hypothetical protein
LRIREVRGGGIAEQAASRPCAATTPNPPRQKVGNATTNRLIVSELGAAADDCAMAVAIVALQSSRARKLCAAGSATRFIAPTALLPVIKAHPGATRSRLFARLEIAWKSLPRRDSRPHVWRRFVLPRADWRRLNYLRLASAIQILGIAPYSARRRPSRVILADRCSSLPFSFAPWP